ncbi:hypothetical protein AAX26_00658 [Aliarcobacter thereius]|uniref:Copper resistance protein D domain-containing protein n=2 Tax=Aliarcobacter thereius TaxID=544718 RepID=A0A1C0B8I6_9BACT|nr:hypothetical protein [Aliarcobacter thereius]OCL87570.1 hypothetical protein AAX26_00658 [Aliarcobacter thereius]OCL93814.1 hypothetical protein AAX25_00136 [Aliarcobacter thereius]OCL95222.1 hypothetical protein AA347_00676 [Aliarcobacter thereius LMG 24486]OCL99887.1 hypothetical protein AAX29_00937 [Aliarcobacter thereius]QBF16788.1 putative membrane protein [Aliarcobacter thereius LMG 24486]
MKEFFTNYLSIILFLHLISVVVWIGGMIVIRFSVHYSFLKINDPKIKLGRSLENLRIFFNMVIVSIIIIFITAIIMHLTLDLSYSDLRNIAILKEIILLIMTIIFIIVFIKRNHASKFFENNDLLLAKKELEIISKYLIPINISLGIIEIFLGVILRGF